MSAALPSYRAPLVLTLPECRPFCIGLDAQTSLPPAGNEAKAEVCLFAMRPSVNKAQMLLLHSVPVAIRFPNQDRTQHSSLQASVAYGTPMYKSQVSSSLRLTLHLAASVLISQWLLCASNMRARSRSPRSTVSPKRGRR